MNLEDKIWLNQHIFSHRDLQYNTGNSLDLSFSSSTQDFQTYAAPSLNLSISTNNARKVFTINYQTAIDLTKTFKLFSESSKKESDSFDIYRKYGDRSLKIEIHKTKETQEQVASITISYSTSDSTLIILPASVFFSLMCLIRDFATYYLSLTFDFSTRSLITEILSETKELKNSIKILPSLLVDTGKKSPVKIIDPNVDPESGISYLHPPNSKQPEDIAEKLDSALASDFSSFINENIDKISIPEIGKVEKEPETKIEEYNSSFINKVLKNDISVLENLINSASVKMDNSILTFKDILIKNMGIEGIDWLPGISQNELKSALYVTKVFFGTSLFSFVNKNTQVPKSVPVIKYQVDPKLVQGPNMDLAYDLLLVSGYLRLLKNQLETKLVDQVASKAFLYLSLRCFTDIFTFSFLEDKDAATIKNCVLSRFKSYQKSGFFKKYEFMLETYTGKQITETDIGIFLDEVTSKIVRKSSFIKQVHEKNYEDGIFTISFENDLSVEQIINGVSYLEIAKLIGIDINNDADLSRLIDPINISEEVKEIFNKKRKPVPKKKDEDKEKDTNLVRFVNYYKNEIPEKFKDKFMNYVKELHYGPYVLDNEDFPLEEFGENIVKGLYVWQETDNRDEKYTDFYIRFESCLLDKKLIISKARGSVEVPEESWIDNFE